MRRADLPSLRSLRRLAVALPVAGTVAVGVATSFASSPAVAGEAPVATRVAAPPTAGTVVPDRDPFYAAPTDIGRYRPGQVVASRPVTPKGLSGTAAWQISYRTDDSHNAAELAVTTLLVPTAAWGGVGARPVVSIQAAEDSTGTQCAPSYGVASGYGVAGLTATRFAQPLLKKGWAVAMPDFEGPKSVFMAGVQAGHAVLDGIRAARTAGLGGVTTTNPWALGGYSGGAEATGWAAQLQSSYAPDVHLAGAAIGGIPADPTAVARYLDGGLTSGFEFAAAAGLDAEYPEAGIRGLLTADGTAALAKARGKCLVDLLIAFPFTRLAAYATVADPLAVPSVARVLRANTLGGSAPTMPIFDYHANTDEIVPVAQDNTLVAAWCAGGATVQKVRDAIGEHALEAAVRQADALAFLADRFAGKAPVDTC